MSSRKQGRDVFEEVFQNLPADPDDRLDALFNLQKQFRESLAKRLQPLIRTLLQEAPPVTYEERRGLVRRLNLGLHDAGLAIADPDSRQPTTIIAEQHGMRLQSRAAVDGHQSRSKNTKNIAPLELVEHIRHEPISSWRDRAKRGGTSTASKGRSED